MTLNDELKYFVGVCAPVLCGFLLASQTSGDSLWGQVGFLLWLIVGAAVLFVRYDFPRVAVAKLPQESLLKGLFMFGSWLLWPVWAFTLPVRQ